MPYLFEKIVMQKLNLPLPRYKSFFGNLHFSDYPRVGSDMERDDYFDYENTVG